MKRGVLEEGRFVLCFPILFPCFSVTWRVSSRRSAVCNSCGREAVCPSLFCRRLVSACFVLPSRHSSFVVENRCVCVCACWSQPHSFSSNTLLPLHPWRFPGGGRPRPSPRRRAPTRRAAPPWRWWGPASAAWGRLGCCTGALWGQEWGKGERRRQGAGRSHDALSRFVGQRVLCGVFGRRLVPRFVPGSRRRVGTWPMHAMRE